MFQAGHLVTVYEKNDKCGGLMMYGIPSMKIEKQVFILYITVVILFASLGVPTIY